MYTTMADNIYVLWIVIVCHLVATSGHAHDGVAAVVDQVRILDEELAELRNLKTDIPRLEALLHSEFTRIEDKLSNNLVMGGLALKDNLVHDLLPDYIQSQVEKALSRILNRQSLDSLVSSHVLSKVEHLEAGMKKFKRQLGHLRHHFSNVEDDQHKYRAELMKTRREHAEHVMTADEKLVRLETLLNETRTRIEQQEEENIRLRDEIQRVNASVGVTSQAMTSQAGVSPASIIPSTAVSLTTLPAVMSLVQKQEMKRLIILPFHLSVTKQFYQLNYHTNQLMTYPLKLSNVYGVIYEPFSKRLLLSTHSPDAIYSYGLDRNDSTTLRENVCALAMAVDIKRKLVIMTTWLPRFSVSRMTVEGRNFRGIVDLSQFNYPCDIAIDQNKMVIYVAGYDKLLRTTYSGQRPHILATGSDMRTVSLDPKGLNLYYGDGNKVIRRSVSDHCTAEITDLGYVPQSILHYNNSLLVSGFNAGIIDVVYLDASKPLTLRLGSISDYSRMSICLAP